MTFNRRRFLTNGGLTLGLGGAFAAHKARAAPLPAAPTQPRSDYARIFAESEFLPALGLPRSWESLRQGFHPFSPDRIDIIGYADEWRDRELANDAERMKKLLPDWPRSVDESFWGSDSFRLYLEISRLLSAYYPGMPRDTWLQAFVTGEQFYGSMNIDRVKWLLSLDFCVAHTPAVANPPADWWLFLLRRPFAIDCYGDAGIVRVAVGQVYADPLPERLFFRCHAGYLCQEWLRLLRGRGLDFIDHVAALDRVSAARLMNLEVARTLEKLAERGRGERHAT
jgi:hypothetical protein